MARSFRYVIRGVRGRVPANFNMPDVIKSNHAVVQITAGQISFNTTPSEVFVNGQMVTQKFMYIRGDANVWVTNVCPHFNDHFNNEPGGVEFVLHVDWPNPLDIAVTLTVED